PEEKMGRALGLTTAAIGLASPIGVAIGGVTAEAIGIAPFFVVDGILCLILGLLIYIPKSVRALDKAEPETLPADTGATSALGNETEAKS
ncbi:MAG: MFS transporter, partial [Raoultibacter sp.]